MSTETRNTQCVVVTGGAGYIGSHVVRLLLERNCRVRVIDSLMHGCCGLLPYFGHPNLSLINAPILGNGAIDAAMQDADGVIHLAAVVGDAACNRDTGLAISTNVDGTRRVLDAARRAGVARMVLASTCSVYGASGDNGLLTETSPVNPVSLYAETKIKAEGLALNAADDAFGSTILRLSTLYGFSPRMRFDLALNFFAAQIARELEVVIYGRHHWRPMLHVADAAAAFVAMLDAPVEVVNGQVYNVGVDRENYRMGQFVEILPEIIPNARVVIHETANDPRSYHVGFEKIVQAVGYDVTYTVREGLAQVHQLVRQGWLSDPDDPHYRN